MITQAETYDVIGRPDPDPILDRRLYGLGEIKYRIGFLAWIQFTETYAEEILLDCKRNGIPNPLAMGDGELYLTIKTIIATDEQSAVGRRLRDEND